MRWIFGRGARDGASLSDNRGGPWGPGGGDDDGSGGEGGPRNPWGQRRRKPAPRGGGNGGDRGPGPLDEIFRKGRERFGGGFPSDGRPYWLYGLIAFLALWILFTSVWRIGPQERGVVSTLGYYSRTMGPGIGFSWPWPIGSVTKLDVEGMQTITIPPNGENLILTGDQNVIDLHYSVRWNIKNPELFVFQIAEPQSTIREVAESAMRAAVARVSLDDAIGAGRADIEQRVEQSMQQLLDDYGSGVQIQGVAINQSVPPQAVNEAFLEVSAAQQRAQSAMNNARSYALQQTARAQGEAAAFEKVFAEYRAAPEVTRRRMYYETMERVLQHVDTTIVEAPGVTPYLALPEIQRGRAPPSQTQPQAQGAPAR
ncbi:MAG: modulator of FtsH protease HflK [Sphingomonadales bacterium]|jgi:membrane protease subunit HflK|nr:modulator of FtsH protease HflK [Sphingomonadales bacterium]